MESLASPPASSQQALSSKQRDQQSTPPTSQPTSPGPDLARWTSASSSSSTFTLCSNASPGVLHTKRQDENEDPEEEEQNDHHDGFLSPNPTRRSRSLSTETIVSPTSPTATTKALPSSLIPPPRYPDLPSEIILYIFRFLTTAHDLRSAVLVCKLWCCCGMDLLWSKPSLLTMDVIERMIQTISLPKTVFPYVSYIRRLNLSFLAPDLTDPLLTQFAACSRLERLLLAGSVKTTEAGLKQILTLSSCRGLYALDLSEIPAVTNSLLEHISLNCPQLHTLYLGSCPQITDDALVKIAARCTQLKRIKLSQCTLLTDISILALTKHCPQLMEVDLTNCNLITDTAVKSLFGPALAPQIRDINLTQVSAHLTDMAFEMILPSTHQFEGLRILNLTSCVNLTDDTLLRILPATPRLRNLALTKCDKITDRGASAIKAIGKYLHYLHLGHCAKITDRLIEILANHCPRIRYLDLACCSKITDAALFELAQLPKLRRLGLVKCSNITDHGLYGLLFSQILRQTLERVHLSYCVHLSEVAVASLVIQCSKLTHLSLTGVPAFIAPRFQAFCRPPPIEFTPHQREVFCVFSGRGVRDLRQAMIEEVGAVKIFGNQPQANGSLGPVSAPTEPPPPPPSTESARIVETTTNPPWAAAMPPAWADLVFYRTFAGTSADHIMANMDSLPIPASTAMARALVRAAGRNIDAANIAGGSVASSSTAPLPLNSSQMVDFDPFSVEMDSGGSLSAAFAPAMVIEQAGEDVDMEDVSGTITAAQGNEDQVENGSLLVFRGAQQHHPHQDEEGQLGTFFRSSGHTAAVQQLFHDDSAGDHRHDLDRALHMLRSDAVVADQERTFDYREQVVEDSGEEGSSDGHSDDRGQRLRLPSPGTLAKSLNREGRESGAGSASPAEDNGDDDEEEEEDEDL
ncbi:F-box and leucine-rich repeat protein GRR1 [Entomortierella parvispora]|uniref:F-box and leucine-rich repeat protein GRR1 n=1 Tax=Entomortierella parvispora TaxID=205924 RepID=A0A9P3LYJ0_9FUNG|nr:F-box and leucine-rich repeat protein GRR1 [Entomortierella parvispora]